MLLCACNANCPETIENLQAQLAAYRKLREAAKKFGKEYLKVRQGPLLDGLIWDLSEALAALTKEDPHRTCGKLDHLMGCTCDLQRGIAGG